MKTRILYSGILWMLLVLFTACSGNKDKEPPPSPQPSPEQLAQRGEYLVTVMGCHDCHSPKEITPQSATLIPDLLLSGYQTNKPAAPPEASCIKNGWVLITMDLTTAAGPWGVSYSANLTSDQTGIGNWTIDNFKRALKEGKYKGLEGSRTLLPPMPWVNFVSITDEDVNAIFAYLQSTKPVKNVVPQAITPDELAMTSAQPR